MQIARLILTVLTIVVGVDISSAQQARTPAPPEQLGKSTFRSCCIPAVKEQFDRALALLLHSFWAKEAIQGFNAVLRQDPDCVIAYWGLAMAAQH